MKKTLLVAAATLAVGIHASQAQVYSQNVVGYVNVTVPHNGYALVANQLVNGSDANQTNNDVQTVLGNGGFVSDPSAGGNCTTLYSWTGTGFETYQYFSYFDATNNGIGFNAGWYDSTYTYASAANSNPNYFGQSQGDFIYNNASTNIVVTLVGTVPQGTNIVTLTPGYSLISVNEPISADINTLGFVGTSDPTAGGNCTTLYNWVGNGYEAYQYFTYNDATNNGIGFQAGWYDSTYTAATVATPVGQAFFITQPPGDTIVWTNSFTVN